MNDKLISLTNKLYHNHKGLSPSDIFSKIKSQSSYKIIYDKLSPKDIIILCFMISNMNEKTNSKKLFDEISNNLFVFSIVYIDSDEVYVHCSDCGGSGEIKCPECNAEEQVSCDECNGDGEIGGESCNSCSGDGMIDCRTCAYGYITCDTCKGSGDVINENYKSITQNYIVSFDKTLFNFFEIEIDTMDKISENMVDKIYYSNKSLTTYIEYGSSYEFDKFEEGDSIFVGFDSDNFNLFKGQTGLNPMNITSYIN